MLQCVTTHKIIIQYCFPYFVLSIFDKRSFFLWKKKKKNTSFIYILLIRIYIFPSFVKFGCKLVKVVQHFWTGRFSSFVIVDFLFSWSNLDKEMGYFGFNSDFFLYTYIGKKQSVQGIWICTYVIQNLLTVPRCRNFVLQYFFTIDFSTLLLTLVRPY